MMLSFWQHIPLSLHPIAFSIGFFAIRWYALCFLIGFFAAWKYCEHAVRKEGGWLSREKVFDMALSVFFGALIGGRLGFALFYAPQYFLSHPLALFIPYDFSSHIWIGISGMSFHGGLLGVIAILVYYSRKAGASFWKISDLAAVSLPIAIFFGRIGNFVNGELYGRITSVPWGMFFPNDPLWLRHASPLYEASLEGLLLFGILFFLRKKKPYPGMLSSLFVISYALFRFFSEFFREPDAGIGLLFGIFTRGQVFSFIMLLSGFFLFLWLKKSVYGKIFKKAESLRSSFDDKRA